MRFESELAKGRLVIPECPRCKKTVWPPSDFCNACLEGTNWVPAPVKGTIVEFSRQDGGCFCVADIGGLRLVCGITSGIPKEGGKVMLERCGIRNGYGFFDVRVLG